MKKNDKEIKSRDSTQKIQKEQKRQKKHQRSKEIPRIDGQESLLEGAHQIPNTLKEDQDKRHIIRFPNTSYKMTLIAFKHEK